MTQSPPIYVAEQLDDLPMLPDSVARLLALSPESEEFLPSIHAIARQDPLVAAKLLQAANSAASAPITPIETLERAVLRIGARRAVSLIASLALSRTFKATTPGHRDLWAHAIEVAVGARVLAELRAVPGVDPERAYLAGLLHDLGRFLLVDREADDAEVVDERGWDNLQDLLDNERAFFGVDHAELGWQICERLGIPPEIGEIVRDHHRTEELGPSTGAEPKAQFAAILQMADLLSITHRSDPRVESFDFEQLRDYLSEECVPDRWKVPLVEPESLASHVEPILVESQLMVEILGIGPPDQPRP